MRILVISAIVFLWWCLAAIDDLLEKKLSPKSFNIMRWIMVIPISLAAYFSSTLVFDLGVFWPMAALPGLVIGGMVTAPSKPWIAAIIVVPMSLIIGASVFANAWEKNKTREWISSSAGMALSCGAFFLLNEWQGSPKNRKS